MDTVKVPVKAVKGKYKETIVWERVTTYDGAVVTSVRGYYYTWGYTPEGSSNVTAAVAVISGEELAHGARGSRRIMWTKDVSTPESAVKMLKMQYNKVGQAGGMR
jgi:homoserine acetyltransferase